jgi:DNA-binding NarL/FixJ family response regulator
MTGTATSLPAAWDDIQSNGSPKGLEALTPREKSVLLLMADGLTTKEIACRLSITFKTASCHRYRVLAKLGVRNSIQAVRYAIRNGLVQP